MNNLLRPAPRWVDEKPTVRASIASDPSGPQPRNSPPLIRPHWPAKSRSGVSRLVAVTMISGVGGSMAGRIDGRAGRGNGAGRTATGRGGAAVRTNDRGPTASTRNPAERASWAIAWAAFMRPRSAGAGRRASAASRMAMLTPACRPRLCAACATVPRGTSISGTAAGSAVGRSRSEARTSREAKLRIGRLPRSSRIPIGSSTRRATARASAGRA